MNITGLYSNVAKMHIRSYSKVWYNKQFLLSGAYSYIAKLLAK